MATDNKKMNRRDFLRIMGTATTAATAALAGCGPGNRTASAPSAAPDQASAGRMTLRTAARTGDEVSLLGYGMMRLPTLPEAAGPCGIVDQEAVNDLVDYAIAHGVNYFDTSPVYVQGWSERSTGLALKRHPREKFFVATKLSNFSDYSRENSLAMYRKSFEELQVDRIDYYLLHSVGNGGIETFRARYIDNGMLDFLLAERETGRIRNLGFSFHGTKEVFDEVLALDEYARWDFVQIQLNYVDWRHASGNNVDAEYLYAELRKRGIQAIVMEPLLGGRLSKVPRHIAARLKQRSPETSVASWAFRFAGSPEGVLTVLSGMTYKEHLQDNLRTYTPLVPLDEAGRDFLEETAQLMLRYPTVPCTDCKYCMPCPYGIDIPAILRHYNRCLNEGNVSASSQNENYRRARRAFLVGYGRSVPKERQADRCIGCGQCSSHCPQSIDIPGELRRIDRYVEALKRGDDF